MKKHILTQIIAVMLLFLYIAIMVLGGADTITGYGTSDICGNYVCEIEESYATCPKDCATTCGDNKCEEHETYTCVMDCREARTAQIEEKAFFSTAVLMVFAVCTAVMFVGIALISTPSKPAGRRNKHRASRR